MPRLFKIAKDLLSDPGLGFNIGGILLFAGSGPIGMAATVGATTIVTAVKIVKALEPAFLQKDNSLTRFIKDERTPLWLLTGAMGAVTASSIASGAALISAAMGTVFAVGDGLMALQLGRAIKNIQNPDAFKSADKTTGIGNFLKRLAVMPEPYMALGFMMSGLMTGGLSMLAFPLVIGGAAISVANTLKGKAEHEGHSKLFYAGAMAVFGVVGLLSGNPAALLPAIANFVCAPYMAVLEGQITPGGLPQVWKNVKNSVTSIFKRPAQYPVPASVELNNATVIEYAGNDSSRVANLPSLSAAFSQGQVSNPAYKIPDIIARHSGNIP